MAAPGLGDLGVRDVDARGQPGPHARPLAPADRVHLDLGPAVARVAPRDEVGAAEELAAGDHDAGARPVVDDPLVDPDPDAPGRG